MTIVDSINETLKGYVLKGGEAVTEQKLSIAKEQQKTKPEIETVFNKFLNGERLKNALDFIAYLREIKMPPRWYAANAWKINFKGKFFLSIRINGGNTILPIHYGLEHGSWHIGHWGQGDFKLPNDLSGEFEDLISYEKFKEFIWANVHECKNCPGCKSGKQRTFFGKSFEFACNLRIENPNAESIECAKKLLEYKKKALQKPSK